MFTEEVKIFAKYGKELDSLTQTKIFCPDIGEEFEIEQCPMFVINR